MVIVSLMIEGRAIFYFFIFLLIYLSKNLRKSCSSSGTRQYRKFDTQHQDYQSVPNEALLPEFPEATYVKRISYDDQTKG